MQCFTKSIKILGIVYYIVDYINCEDQKATKLMRISLKI